MTKPFTVTSSPDGETCTTESTTCTVSGLTNGTEYTVPVKASNAAGDSAASAASNPVTPIAPTPPPAPAPVPPAPPVVAPPASPSVAVKVKALKRKSRLKVDVNPNKGKGYWRFQVQKQRPNGSWKALKKCKTSGKKEVRTINLKRGKYRVVVKPKFGYVGTTSAPVFLKR